MKIWQDMNLEEKLDLLRREMDHKNSQVAGLQNQITEIGNAVRTLEKKLEGK